MLKLANTTSTAIMKTPRELRELLRDCGFKVRRRRGNEEVWEHPHQIELQIVLLATDIHTVHQSQR